MLLWPPLTGTQLSPVASLSWVLPSGHTPGQRHDRWAKPGEGLRCCVCLHTRNQITEKLEGIHAPDDNATVETRLCQLHNVIQSTARKVLGRAHHQHQDWFDDNDADISNLLTEKNGLHKPTWTFGLTPPKQPFSDATISDAAIDRLPQVDTKNDLDLPPSPPETIRALPQISSGKAPGSHAIPPEVYKHGDTLKKSLKQLQINPATWEDLVQDRPAWKRSVKTGSAIYEDNRIAAAKAKRAARKSPAPRTNTANAQALPTCPRCQRIFRARIGLVGHFRTQCTNNPLISTFTSNSANSPSDSPTLTLGINSITSTIIETTSL
ncbi:unnamed protein product [Schistocephalus solidus]|uniref:C2H2-type domain-containing protein n=1 Tax=Schistocephalus solidus TaxID=70667 RepID=A0A183SY29_SCHSO|nr:unnamed protein product [Schistocephalus solidus]